jgi:hypothetical protein
LQRWTDDKLSHPAANKPRAGSSNANAAICLPQTREPTQGATEVKKKHTFGIYALVLAFMLLLESPTSYAIAQERVQDLDQYFRLLVANQDFRTITNLMKMK